LRNKNRIRTTMAIFSVGLLIILIGDITIPNYKKCYCNCAIVKHTDHNIICAIKSYCHRSIFDNDDHEFTNIYYDDECVLYGCDIESFPVTFDCWMITDKKLCLNEKSNKVYDIVHIIGLLIVTYAFVNIFSRNKVDNIICSIVILILMCTFVYTHKNESKYVIR